MPARSTAGIRKGRNEVPGFLCGPVWPVWCVGVLVLSVGVWSVWSTGVAAAPTIVCSKQVDADGSARVEGLERMDDQVLVERVQGHLEGRQGREGGRHGQETTRSDTKWEETEREGSQRESQTSPRG